MALVLKKHSTQSTGVLILTHKEQALLGAFRSYRDRYVIGCHIGCDHRHKAPSGFDFYLASNEQLPPGFAKKNRVIEMNSRNFLPNEYHHTEGKSKNSLLNSIHEIEKVSRTKISEEIKSEITQSNSDYIWDILWVNKPHRVKNIQIFLDQLKILFTQQGVCKTLLICALSPNEKGRYKEHFLDVENYIQSRFTPAEQKFISLLRPDTGGNEGADNALIPPFYQWSNVFAFYSEKEGESRVVSEAACCGCRVVYYKNVMGGSDDYLTNENSVAFESYDISWKTLGAAVQRSKIEDCSEIHNTCLVSNTLDRFTQEIAQLCASRGRPFNGPLRDIPNLHFELPAHNHRVPWKSENHETGDLFRHMLPVFFKSSRLGDV